MFMEFKIKNLLNHYSKNKNLDMTSSNDFNHINKYWWFDGMFNFKKLFSKYGNRHQVKVCSLEKNTEKKIKQNKKFRQKWLPSNKKILSILENINASKYATAVLMWWQEWLDILKLFKVFSCFEQRRFGIMRHY